MKIRISKENLLKSIQIVSRAIPGKTTMSIMQCIMINASGMEICLIANDMELGIQTVAQGIILERGMIAVDAQIFSNIIRKLPDNDVEIGTAGERVTIKCENSFSFPSGNRPHLRDPSLPVYSPRHDHKDDLFHFRK